MQNASVLWCGWTCEWMCNMLWWTLWICVIVYLFICWLILNIIFIVYKVFAFELKRLNTKDASTSTIVYSRKQILQQHLPIIVLWCLLNTWKWWSSNLITLNQFALAAIGSLDFLATVWIENKFGEFVMFQYLVSCQYSPFYTYIYL
jgi:hypothetical protein